MLYVTGNVVVAVTVEEFYELGLEDSACLVDVEHEHEGVESCGCHYNLQLPVLERHVIVLLRNRHPPEERQIRHMQILHRHQPIQVNKRNLHYLNRLPPTRELEIHKEQPMSCFSNNKTINRRVVSKDQFSTGNIGRSTGPVDSMLEVVRLDKLDKIKHLRIVWVMVHRPNHHPTSPISMLWILVHINQYQNIL